MRVDNFDEIVKGAKDYSESMSSRFEDFQDKDWDNVEKAQYIGFKSELVKFVMDRTNDWLFGMFVIFGFTGISNLCLCKPFMSDAVLIALISGTSFMGLVAIILKSLFKS